MHIVAAQTGDRVLLTCVQVVEIAGPITEAVLVSFLLCHQGQVMAIEAKLFHRTTKLVLEIGGVRGMTGEAAVFRDRRMDALLLDLIIVTLKTELGTLVFHCKQAMVALMVAASGGMAGSAFPFGQPAMDERGIHFAGVTFVARLAANGINSSLNFSSRNG